MVDSLGLLLAVGVTAGHVDGAQAVPQLFTRLEGQPMGNVIRMDGDNTDHHFTLYQWVEANVRWDLVIVRRPNGGRGWVRLPIRWRVERTFGWLGQGQRLSRDREKSVRSAEAFVKWAMIQLMLNRLDPKGTEAEFQYRAAS